MRAPARRRQLLEVAAELFAQHGYRGTTTAKLAEAAGITEPILYRHFKNKHDLFVTLIDEVSRDVISAWQEALDGVAEPIERLRVLLAGNPATHTKGRGIYRVIFQAMSEVDSDPAIARPIRRHVTRLHSFIKDELDQLQIAGIVRNDEPAAALAWLLITVAVGYGMVSPLGVRGQAEVVSKVNMQRLLEDLTQK
jgi:AcrR family transcriptional regulator